MYKNKLGITALMTFSVILLSGCSKTPEEKLQSIAKELESHGVSINGHGQKLTGEYVGSGFVMGQPSKSKLNAMCDAAGSEDYFSEFSIGWVGKSSRGSPRMMSHDCKL